MPATIRGNVLQYVVTSMRLVERAKHVTLRSSQRFAPPQLLAIACLCILSNINNTPEIAGMSLGCSMFSEHHDASCPARRNTHCATDAQRTLCVGQRGSGATCSAAQVLPHGRAGNAAYPSKTPQHGKYTRVGLILPEHIRLKLGRGRNVVNHRSFRGPRAFVDHADQVLVPS